ncbi:Uncharacterised protein [Streptococcus pneumoniae]|nr:Uncharacterised protein [Streptococcus pneumoniae]
MKELSSGELQLVNLTYQKITQLILQEENQFLTGCVNSQVKKKMTILSYVASSAVCSSLEMKLTNL